MYSLTRGKSILSNLQNSTQPLVYLLGHARSKKNALASWRGEGAANFIIGHWIFVIQLWATNKRCSFSWSCNVLVYKEKVRESIAMHCLVHSCSPRHPPHSEFYILSLDDAASLEKWENFRKLFHGKKKICS